MKLSTVKSERKPLTIPFEEMGDELHIVYVPGALTPEVEDQVMEALEQPGQGAFLTGFITKLIESWDLLDDDEQPIPLTPGGLRSIPINFLGVLLTKIREDMNPGEDKGD
jgi:hypothetical protein